jgi:histidinol-phosphate aminotransferase
MPDFYLRRTNPVDIESLIRPSIRALKPYHSARQDFLSGVLLDANENSFGSAVSMDSISLNRYPDPYQRELRKALAALNEVAEDRVFVGVGSDEVIDLLVRIFCQPQRDSLILLEPTYGMYRVAASLQEVEIRSCLLTEDFQIDVESVKCAVSAATKLIFCCSPNNPTSNVLNAGDIVALCDFGPVVIVDEAYADFAQTESLGKQVASHPNLVVMRTLSKAWGLAGIRLGYCIADPLVVSYLMKVKLPYNINALTSLAALQALRKKDEVRQRAAAIIQERQWLSTNLAKLSCVERVFPSDANFLLVRCRDASELYHNLASKGIIVRNRSSEPRLQNCLRITVGTRKENEMLLQALREICL